MTIEEEDASSKRICRSSILSPKSVTEAGPRRLDVPFCVGPITIAIYACGLD